MISNIEYHVYLAAILFTRCNSKLESIQSFVTPHHSESTYCVFLVVQSFNRFQVSLNKPTNDRMLMLLSSSICKKYMMCTYSDKSWFTCKKGVKFSQSLDMCHFKNCWTGVITFYTGKIKQKSVCPSNWREFHVFKIITPTSMINKFCLIRFKRLCSVSFKKPHVWLNR